MQVGYIGRRLLGRYARPFAALIALGLIVGVPVGAAAPSKTIAIVFATQPQTLTAGVASAPITVQMQNTTGPVSVTLSTTSLTGVFRDSANTANITTVTIPAGQTTASFRYVETVSGSAVITAKAKALNGQFNGNLQATQNVTTQPAALSSIVVAPASATVSLGVKQAYTATGRDAFGNTTGDLTSTATFSITPDGSCAGPSCSATTPGTHTVTAASGGVTGTATLIVNAGAFDHLVISPQTATVTPGTSQSYSAQAFDVAGASLGDITASTVFTISPDGSCSANSCTPGDVGSHTVTGSYGGKQATATLMMSAQCRTSGPAGGAYTVTVCLSVQDGSTVTGATPVTGTVSVNGPDPHTAKLLFTLDGGYVLTDYQTPYTFTLPTARWVDGPHQLSVQAIERDGFTASRASVTLNFQNGVTQPPPQSTGFSPTTGTPAGGSPFVLAAVGDGAGGETGATTTTNLIAGWNPNMFLYLGDVYEKGTPTEFLNWYGAGGGPFYGQFRSITNPTIGNHEYEAGQAPGYFDYWQSPPDYYSVDIAPGWHLVSLNSNLSGAAGSPQYQWLSNDLGATSQPCTLVYFHHPLFNIGPEPIPARFADIWPLLAQRGVDVVLTGHDHDYQRWVPMAGNGTPDPAGPTEFVVGTGGHSLQSFVSTDPRVANSASGSFGAMRLELTSKGASYRYMTAAGTTLDSGAITCDPNGVDSQPPTQPTGLAATTTAATTISTGSVDLSWNASTDDSAVAGYNIYRDGTLIATTGTQPHFTDQPVAPQTDYVYQVAAVDAAQNESDPSDPVTVHTPAVAPIFSDGFESGDLSAWTTQGGLVVQNADAFTGTWAAEGIATGTETAYLWKTLPTGLNDVYFRIRFKLISNSATTVYLERFRTGTTATSLLGVYVSSTGKLGMRNDLTAVATTSPVAVSLGQWHTLQVRVTIADTASQVATTLDGTPVAALTSTQSLGTTPVSRVQLGENATGKSYDVRFDDVGVDTVPLP
jgi:hypothetical protein